MLKTIRNLTLAAVLMAIGTATASADSYIVDPVHSSISFMIGHQNISYIHGRFNDYSGKFVIESDPAQTSFFLSIKVESVDTNNVKRDEHLRAPDYFNVKQFPNLTFQSTKVKPVEGGFEVTGDLTIHGVTKVVTLNLKGYDKVVEFPKGTPRVGGTTSLVIKRSDYGMTTALPNLGDEVHITIGIEAAKEAPAK
jgi:polyisoprenoid-binding protein YceI